MNTAIILRVNPLPKTSPKARIMRHPRLRQTGGFNDVDASDSEAAYYVFAIYFRDQYYVVTVVARTRFAIDALLCYFSPHKTSLAVLVRLGTCIDFAPILTAILHAIPTRQSRVCTVVTVAHTCSSEHSR